MVEETEKSTTNPSKEEAEKSSSSTSTITNVNNGEGDESEAEEREIVGGGSDNDVAAKDIAVPPVKLTVGADFHCFKDKIEPKWEDPDCANGGKWTVTLLGLLAMIGEQFDHEDEICGAVNAANEAAQLIIGRQWKEFLDYNDTIGDDAKKLDKAAKNRYSV
ncbi:eukarytic translation initiation factor [Olea europaea subsp. europaea]|uniref:eIF-4F 25 kDa subunit n=1 Tax=Olea europaea subsp. europaea TaxID=158383 RepID=A0A8S0QB46_OLEEU|nr:eukarytic translation initiation factor [Olea europaea subsp. europaea]